MTVFCLLIFIIIYLETPLSDVKRVEVEGNLNVADETIVKLTGIDQRTNFWSVDKNETEKAVESHEQIKKAEIKKIFPNTILVQITEWKRVAYVSSGSSFYPILENGHMLKETKSVKAPDAPILIGFKEDEYTQLMAKQLKSLPRSISYSISEIHYTPVKMDPYQITLYMNNGFEVRASLKTFADKMKSYPLIVKELDPKEKGVIHLEVGTYFESYEK